MRLPSWMMRGLRVVFVAVAAWLAFRLLSPMGYGWTVIVGAGAAALGWTALRAFRVRQRRAEEARSERWAEALMRPPLRPAAIDALREEIAALDPEKRVRAHAQRSLVLAEILEADGDAAGAAEVLGRIRADALDDTYAAVVRHARAVAALSAGDADGAEAALDAEPGPSGDRAIDQRIRLLRGLIAVERGAPGDALEIATDIRDEAGGDRELDTEARVLRAVALEAQGDAAAAYTAMAAIGDEMLDVLVVLGLPRVRALAARVIEGREGAEVHADVDG